MKAHPIGWALMVLTVAISQAVGQNPDFRGGSSPAGQSSMAQQPQAPYPDQPVVPQYPSLQRRVPEGVGGPQQQSGPGAGAPNAAGQGMGMVPPHAGPPQPPFALTPAEEAQLDQLLLFWQQSSQRIKTFRAKFRRFEYNAWNAQNQDQPTQDNGELRYQAPDKGFFRIVDKEKGQDKEKWVCDGKSLYQYDFSTHRVHEWKLPPQLRGKAIANGPMPFLFGAEAQQLKRRYWLRITTPPEAKNEIWLEALPKFLADAQEFEKVEIILSIGKNDVMPTAVQIYLPGGKLPGVKPRTVYTLRDIAVNRTDPLMIFQDPFRARIPSGWQKVVEDDGQMGNIPQQRVERGNLPAAMHNRGVLPR